MEYAEDSKAKSIAADSTHGDCGSSDESDYPYLEELEEILRSPALTSRNGTYSDCEDDVYLSSTLENHHFRNDQVNSNFEFNTTFMDTPKSYLYLSTQPPINAVHMEVQENAKIPNNYNLAVDRSGTGLTTAHMMSKHKEALTSEGGDKMDNSLDNASIAEVFFAPSQRFVAMQPSFFLIESSLTL